ncbi:hypothetical protein GYMLUDRAFT_192639 [Collybiopsis luxurians FD-317 M1]|nr:hypothetical protein GYMLUDRAFT_192639 [Collybiopsis luxurians FD-317 M1]
MHVHLHVLLHGLWGTPKHFQSAARVFAARHGQKNAESQDRVELFIVEVNQGTKTYDGIDWGAERAVEEIQEAVRKISSNEDQRVTKFSITGYSLGGLYARYVAAILYTRHFFDSIEPMNFITISTPHVGMPYITNSLFNRITRYLGARTLGNTGKQLYGVDSWGTTGRPLLEVMADKDFVFWKALNAFQRIDIYANAINDRIVPYVSGVFETVDPFDGNVERIKIEFESEYHPMIKSWSLKDDTQVSEKEPRSLMERYEAWKPLPFMGPFIQWNFPYSLILTALLPFILIILIFLLPFIFLSRARSSSSRVKSLEQASMTARDRLVQVFASLEHNIAQKAEEVLEQTAPTTQKGKRKRSEIQLTASQRKMIADLNQLSVRKHLAWIHPTRNSHAVIICREEDQFAGHALGKGVLRYWAEQFVL